MEQQQGKNKWVGSYCKMRLLALILLLIILAALADYLYFLNRVYPGVKLYHFDLGFCTRRQFDEKIERLSVSFIRSGGNAVEVPLRDMGIIWDNERLFVEACRRGRKRCLLSAYLNRWQILKEGAYLSLDYSLDEVILQQFVADLGSQFNTMPENAFFEVSSDELKAWLLPEKPGCQVNPDRLQYLILKTVYQKESSLVVEVPLTLVPADITVTSLREKGIETMMCSFSTPLDLSMEGRVHNIKLAASFLHGRKIAPGEALSLNHIIGDTTPEKGYREAPVIIGGELLPGYGGGICQISSTLYNAVLLADLEIIERHNHQLAISYLPPGRDATMEYGARDFIFRNNQDHYILIHAVVYDEKLTCRLFGASMDKEINIETIEIEKHPPATKHRVDPELPPGEKRVEEGVPGYIVEVWKNIYMNEELISSKKISVDQYYPYPTVIWRGLDGW